MACACARRAYVLALETEGCPEGVDQCRHCCPDNVAAMGGPAQALLFQGAALAMPEAEAAVVQPRVDLHCHRASNVGV